MHKLHVTKTKYDIIRHYKPKLDEDGKSCFNKETGVATSILDYVEKNVLDTDEWTEEFLSIYNLEKRKLEIEDLNSQVCKYKTKTERMK